MEPVEIRIAVIKKSWYKQLRVIDWMTDIQARLARPLGWVIDTDGTWIIWQMTALSYAKSRSWTVGTKFRADEITVEWNNPDGKTFAVGQLFL